MSLRRVPCLVAALLVLGAAPAPAVAQESPSDDPPPFEGVPPEQPGDDGSDTAPDEPEAEGVGALADTGGRAGLLALTGTGMLMAGVGLRLRIPGA